MGVGRQRQLVRMMTYALLAFGLGIVLIPFWYMLVTSLKPQAMIFEIPPRLWPQAVTSDNYSLALTTDRFGLYFVNSLKVALATTALTVLVTSLLAYAFARLEFPGRRWLFYLLLLGMMIPPVMLIIPQFIIAKALQLKGTHLGLVLVYATMNLAMSTFLLRGYFEGIPQDLEEAARVDGASNWTIFWRLILPLARPGLAVVTISTFLFSWEEFPWAHVSIQETSLRTLPIGIALFQSEHLTYWGQVFAASIVALVPVVIVFLLFQRQFVRGITTSGLKG